MEIRELLKLFDLFCELIKIYKQYKILKRQRRMRRWWVRPTNLTRNELGFFNASFLPMKNIDPEVFFQHTRMTRNVYDILLNLVEQDLTKKSIRRPINFECRLALTLSYLSQGVSPRFLASSYKMGRTTVRRIILETCDVIWNVLSIYVSKPSSIDYELIAKEFEAKWNLPHCIGAIDGKHINIQAPPNSGSSFFNYKKDFSIVLLAVCDANYTFTDICVGAYGSQSDGGILRDSNFGKQLFEGKLPIPKENNLPDSIRICPYFFVGDAAFPLRTNLMRPYPGKALCETKEIFNYRLSRARRIIENSFGILVSRWRILKNTLNLYPENAERVVLAAVALHNFIKLNDTESRYIPPNFIDREDSEHNIHMGEWRNEVESLPPARLGSNNATRSAFNQRDNLADYFVNEGAVPFQYRANRNRL